ncbi:MAG: hypothetical protein RSC08_01600 [Oscillospiraceae bacterium]
MENTIFLPTLSHFQNGNDFLGSFGTLRFAADKAVDGVIPVSSWYGPLCREKSQIAQTKSFPETEEGLAQLRDWLLAQVQD